MSCGYQGRHFGAHYEDATCIGGYLRDLDSCDEPGGELYSGGDDPCPQCNRATYMDRVLEQINEEGWCAGLDGKPCEPPEINKSFSRKERRTLQAEWEIGYQNGIKEKDSPCETNQTDAD